VATRRCEFCRRSFVPDRRVGARQRACSDERCKADRNKAACRSWRERHPANRAREAARAKSYRDQHAEELRARRRRDAPWQRELAAQRERRRLGREVVRHEIGAQVLAGLSSGGGVPGAVAGDVVRHEIGAPGLVLLGLAAASPLPRRREVVRHEMVMRLAGWKDLGLSLAVHRAGRRALTT
jgi:hypothetical protein